MLKHGMLPRYYDADLKVLHSKASKDIKLLLTKLVSSSKDEFFKRKFNFYLFGSYRTGKTWTLHAIMNHIINVFGDRSVFYVTSPQLATYAITNKNLEENYTWIKYLAKVRVLMLDDLGQEYRGSNSGFAEFNLEKFLRFRFNYNKITYIASNANPERANGDVLEDLYGAPLANFISSEYIQYHVVGENMSDIVMKDSFNGKS